MFIKKCLVVALSTVLAAPFVISQEAAVANASQAAATGGAAGTAAAGTFAGVSVAAAIAVGISRANGYSQRGGQWLWRRLNGRAYRSFDAHHK